MLCMCTHVSTHCVTILKTDGQTEAVEELVKLGARLNATSEPLRLVVNKLMFAKLKWIV